MASSGMLRRVALVRTEMSSLPIKENYVRFEVLVAVIMKNVVWTLSRRY
jgi:hypothetical protein